MRMRRWLVIPALAAVSFSGCVYSFKGSSVPTHLKTIAVQLFDDQSGSGEPGLREQLTNKLIDRFKQDNSLQITDKSHSDSMIEGTIASLTDQPLVVAAGEAVTKRHITIMTNVTFQDLKLRKKVFEKQFSDWGDYEVSGGPAQRQTAVSAALDKLSEDILNETVSGW
jgi:hypothetical protein